jgi:CheY-like chemotaxis protein
MPEFTCPLCVLAVDDDEGVRSLLRLALPKFGFRVHIANGGDEAVEIYRRHGGSIDMVLMDVQMPPGMDGPHTLDALRKLNPNVRCCFMSGGTGGYSTADLAALGAVHIFTKPFAQLDEFARVLRQATTGGTA